MNIQGTQSAQAAVSLLKGALEAQTLGASLISSTVDRLNSGYVGMMPAVDANYATQKAVLSSAYSARGIGCNVDLEV